MTFAILQILSGSYIVIFYAVEFVSIATGSDSEGSASTVTIAVMTAFTRFIVSILVSILLFFMGRRTLGIVSGVGTALASLCIVSYLYCKQYKVVLWGFDLNISHSDASAFTIAGLIILYVAMNTLGIFSLPMLLMAETLPANVRGIVSGFTVMLVNIFIFGTTKFYPYTKSIIGPIGIFTWFSVISIIIALYIYLYLPETKDRSLTEIEFYFSTGRNHLWITRDKALYKRKKKKGKCKDVEKTNSSVNLTWAMLDISGEKDKLNLGQPPNTVHTYILRQKTGEKATMDWQTQYYYVPNVHIYLLCTKKMKGYEHQIVGTYFK